MSNVFIAIQFNQKDSETVHESLEKAREYFSFFDDEEFKDYVTITEMPKTDYILKDIPEEFKSVLSYMAYEQGHSAGESEVDMILRNLAFELKPAIQKFEARIRNSLRNQPQEL